MLKRREESVRLSKCQSSAGPNLPYLTYTIHKLLLKFNRWQQNFESLYVLLINARLIHRIFCCSKDLASHKRCLQILDEVARSDPRSVNSDAHHVRFKYSWFGQRRDQCAFAEELTTIHSVYNDVPFH